MRPETGISVDLALVDNSGRRIGTGPDEVSFGAVRLGQWQVHPVVEANQPFHGLTAHLVKFSFDLRMNPGAPAVRWFEVGFSLLNKDSIIAAALPAGALKPQPAQSYALTRNLEFVPVGNDAALVHVPPTDAAVHVYGASGDSIRWLHMAAGKRGARPGSYSVWFVLLAPDERTEQKFRLSARFDPESAEGDDFTPTAKSTDFDIPLPELARSQPVKAARSDESGIGLPRFSPRIFICYAHEDEIHKRKVRDFADLLRELGMDPRIDKDHEGPRKEWDQWALQEIRAADFVVVIASPTCRAVGDGDYEDTDRAGIRSELKAIRNLLQRYPGWAAHLLPVVLPGGSVDDIPMFLAPYTMDHYVLDALIPSETEYLRKTIRTTPAWQEWDRR